MVINTSLDSKRHFVIDVNAHLCFCLILRLSLGEWSNSAVNSNLTLEILKLVQDLFPLALLVLELLGNSIKFLLLEFVLA